VHPLTLEIARLAGRIHGEQRGRGIGIDFPDSSSEPRALHLSSRVVTLNVKHFQAIPGLSLHKHLALNQTGFAIGCCLKCLLKHRDGFNEEVVAVRVVGARVSVRTRN